MEGLRILLLATSIGATMAGSLYAGVQAERSFGEGSPSPEPVIEPVRPNSVSQASVSQASVSQEFVEQDFVEQGDALSVTANDEESGADNPELALGAAVPELEDLERLDEIDLLNAVAAGVESEDIVLDGGVRIGPMKVVDEALAERASSESASRMPPRPRRRVPRPPPGPRLHPNPGQHTVLTARRMIAQNELIQGSCYAYLSEVYTRAGHRSWRKRTIVYRAEREGPYADLSLIRPGDWLYIVNDPGRTPVGTHSVMFVGWEDQARGYARTISHAGWGPPRSGRERGYDVSRTYRIIRPTM